MLIWTPQRRSVIGALVLTYELAQEQHYFNEFLWLWYFATGYFAKEATTDRATPRGIGSPETELTSAGVIPCADKQ